MTIKVFVFNPFQENTYLISNEQGDALIIDPGCFNPAEEKRLTDHITQHGLTVRHVVNTHLHVDHILGNAYLERTTGIQAQAHAGDAFWLNALDAQCRMFGLQPPTEKTNADLTLKGGSTLELGNETFTILEVPGHSPGGIALYNATQGVLFSGDTLFAGSIGRTDLTGGDYDILIKNIREKLMILPDATVVYPGHGPTTTIGSERQYNPYL